MSACTRILALAGILALALTGQAMATTNTTGGPYIDFKGYLGTDFTENQVPVGITTSTTCVTVWGSPHYPPTNGLPYSWWPYPHDLGTYGGMVYTLNDSVLVGPGGSSNNNNTARQMVGASYLTYDNSSTAADMVFTTIYGIDSNPTTLGSLAMTGYDLTSPELSLSGESVLGADGVTYHATVSEIMPAALFQTFLGDGFDLSPFQGSTTGGFYLFQTTIPESALVIVPEPASLTLLTLGATALLSRRRKNPQHAS